jgi:8-oxo-dGTP pyrophosphatase MutT (NUDIX family)
MAFPGGRQHAGDATLLQTAMRETHEEVGLDLSREAEHIGQLDDLQAIARGKPQETVIRPFVFEVHRESPIEVDETEVAEALWTPLLPLYRGEVDTVRPRVRRRRPSRLGPHLPDAALFLPDSGVATGRPGATFCASYA